MQISIRRQSHLCPQGRAAAAWCGIVILALTLLGSSMARAASHLARTASHRKAIKAPVSKPPAGKPPASCANTNLQPTGSNLAAIDAATFCLIGQVRGANHLPPLRLSYSLQSVATGQTR